MLSYREKQLIMVQKYLAERSDRLCEEIEKFLNDADLTKNSLKTFVKNPHFDNFDDLATFVSNIDGYNTYIRIENILSKEELEELDREFMQINDEFKGITQLTKIDMSFLFVAIAMQIIRQVFQPKPEIDSEIFDKSKRKNDKEAADDVKKDDKYKKKIDEAKRKKTENDKKNKENGIKEKSSRYYYAPFTDIVNINKGVPYDVTAGTKQFNLKLSGDNHRAKTLGHDPILGYLFGTCNILTNTMTLGAENLFETYHVKDGAVIAKGNITKAFDYSYKRLNESKTTVGAAVIKQFYHIKSDELSKNGISLPFLELFKDSNTIKQLTDSFDFAQVKHITGIVGKQSGLSVLIDTLISIFHKLYMFVDEYKNGFSIKSQYSEFIDKSDIKNIRTRKILLFSNSIATTSNVILCGVAAGAGILTDNPRMVKFGTKNLDLGGIVMTIIHLFSDIRFITKVKKEFIQNVIDNEFKKKFDLVENQSNLEELMADFNKVVYPKSNI